jgi:hypothetical protein
VSIPAGRYRFGPQNGTLVVNLVLPGFGITPHSALLRALKVAGDVRVSRSASWPA